MDSDEREGCRSLICDVEGIIVAEMVYRCMVCQQVSNSTSEAREHYHLSHMQDEDNNNNSCSSSNMNRMSRSNLSTNGIDDEIEDLDELIREDDLDDYDDDYFHYYKNVLGNYVNNYNQATNALEDTGYFGSEESTTLNNRNPSGNTLIESSLLSSKLVKKNLSNNYGNRVGNSGNGSGVNNGESCTRSGYIKCPVCLSTRYYTTLQRRYGQFTCVACYRFFKEFFTSPRLYVCNNLGNCSLDVKQRCKACWLDSCLKTYTIDSKRKSILEIYKPVKYVTNFDNNNLSNKNNDASQSGNNLQSANNKNCKTSSTAQNSAELIIKKELLDESNIDSIDDQANLIAQLKSDGNNNDDNNNNSKKDNHQLAIKSENSNEDDIKCNDEQKNDINDELASVNDEKLVIEEQDSHQEKSLLKRMKRNWSNLHCDNCLTGDCGNCVN